MPETGIKDGFEEMKKKTHTNIRTTFSDVPLFPEIFCWNDPKSFVPFTFQPNFPETYCKWSEQSQKEQD